MSEQPLDSFTPHLPRPGHGDHGLRKQLFDSTERTDKIMLLERITDMLERGEENEYHYRLLISLNTPEAAQLLCRKARFALDSHVRVRYLELLAHFIGNQLVTRTLVRCMDDEHEEVRHQALRSIARSGSYRATVYLLHLLDQAQGPTLTLCLRCLGYVGGRFCCRKLIALYPDLSPLDRREVLLALARLRSREPLELVLEVAEGPDPGLIPAALHCAGAICLKEEVPRLRRLKDQYPDLFHKRLATLAIERALEHSALDLTIFIRRFLEAEELCRHEDQLKVLRLFPEAELCSLFEQFLHNDVSPRVKRNLLHILRLTQSCHQPLRVFFQQEQDPALRLEALQVLDLMRVHEYLPFYRSLLALTSGALQRAAMLALSKLEDKDLDLFFLDLLAQPGESSTRLESLRVLKTRAKTDSLTVEHLERLDQVLRTILDDPEEDPLVRSRAAWLVGELRRIDILPSVLDFLKEDVPYKHWGYWTLAQIEDERGRHQLFEQLGRSEFLVQALALLDCVQEARLSLGLPLLRDLYHRFDDPRLRFRVIQLCRLCPDPEVVDFLLELARSSQYHQVHILESLMTCRQVDDRRSSTILERLPLEPELRASLLPSLGHLPPHRELLELLLHEPGPTPEVLDRVLTSWTLSSPSAVRIMLVGVRSRIRPSRTWEILDDHLFRLVWSDLDDGSEPPESSLPLALSQPAQGLWAFFEHADGDPLTRAQALRRTIHLVLEERFLGPIGREDTPAPEPTLAPIERLYRNDYLISWIERHRGSLLDLVLATPLTGLEELRDYLHDSADLLLSELCADLSPSPTDRREPWRSLTRWAITATIFGQDLQLGDQLLPALLPELPNEVEFLRSLLQLEHCLFLPELPEPAQLPELRRHALLILSKLGRSLS